MTLPDFFLIGAPKAGTTALHAALSRHPRLHLSLVKEPKFFLCDGIPPRGHAGPGDAHSARERIWRRDRYKALFAGAPTRRAPGGWPELLAPLVGDIRRLERVTAESFADWLSGEGRGEFSARRPDAVPAEVAGG